LISRQSARYPVGASLGVRSGGAAQKNRVVEKKDLTKAPPVTIRETVMSQAARRGACHPGCSVRPGGNVGPHGPAQAGAGRGRFFEREVKRVSHVR